VFCFSIQVCFTKDIKGGLVGTRYFSGSKSIGSWVYRREKEEVGGGCCQRLKRLPNSPLGPTAMGMNIYTTLLHFPLFSMINPTTGWRGIDSIFNSSRQKIATQVDFA
jgi:hypothetical protein